MKKLLLTLLLFSASGFGQTVSTDFLPSTTGYNLGSPTQTWNAFVQNLSVDGNLSGIKSLGGILFAYQYSGATVTNKLGGGHRGEHKSHMDIHSVKHGGGTYYGSN